MLITGMHRSGTTLIGKMFQLASDEVAILHEPLNYKLGVKGVPCWYPSNCEEMRPFVKNILNLDIAYKRWVRLEKESMVRFMGRGVLGGSGLHSLKQARLKSLLKGDAMHLCVKDPFALFLTPLFSEQNVRSVVMVRHPAALYQSMKRMNWHFDFSNLASLESYAPLHLLDKSLFEKRDLSLPDQVGLLWKTLYSLAYENAKNDKNVLFVRHEDFCLQPLETMDQILLHVGLPKSDKLTKEVGKLTSGSSSEAQGKKLHQMERDSSKLAFSWKKHAESEDILMVKERVGEHISLFYKSWSEL